MKITFLLPTAGPWGGVRVCVIYAQHLMQRGHEVLLLSGPRPVYGRKARLRAALRRWVGLSAEPFSAESPIDGSGVPHRTVNRGGRFIDADVPDGDVVIATWWETASSAAQLSPEKGAKVYFVQDYGAHAGQTMDDVAQTWRLPLHKITISQYIADLIRTHIGEDEVPIVANGVDHRWFHASPRGRHAMLTVGFVYDDRPQKGVDFIREAVAHARQQVPDINVICFGSKDVAADVPLPDGAHYHQNADAATVRELYASCDAWLFASRMEGFGLPILEAMACRTPVIATPAGAAPELLAEGGGWLVSPDDPADMALAIQRIAGMSDEQWQEWSSRAASIAARYTWADATDKFEAALVHFAEQDAPHEVVMSEMKTKA
jgi:glycosyltransferase involved in cell wall biosynthesis